MCALCTARLRRAPAFALVAVLSLTLGIGATTAVFSAVNSVVFQPLIVRQPERLVILKPELRGGSVKR